MKQIKELIIEKKNIFKFSDFEAKNLVCQQIIINKIAKSELADKVLLKGGAVMFNMTKNIRRTTRDIDFDLLHYDISSEDSMKNLVYMLNKVDTDYGVKYISSEPLHQEDYKGRRLYLEIKDVSAKLKFSIDVGVHTLFPIKQRDSVFSFDNSNNGVKIMINPPEQIIAEKIYSLAKIGAVSTRIKDIFDIYYLIINSNIDKDVVNQCFDLLLKNKSFGMRATSDIVSRVNAALNDKLFEERVMSSKLRWLDSDYSVVKQTIIEFLETI
ncbi:MAG: nucleotidyl transferase AbiEii/AbiGii toxin family protein [Bacilli bacterium]|nr:nucleotidyl transferase AbiEii/AbiGii toxin family protein [Bacilli bacterium]